MIYDSGPSEEEDGRLPELNNVAGKKPIKALPTIIGNEGDTTILSESNHTPTPSGSVSTSATAANSSHDTLPPTTVLEHDSGKDDSRTTSSSSSNGRTTSIRRGKWTVEETDYIARIIRDFHRGFLNLPAGYTLRGYLSEKLECDPMRITKKFKGEACIGKKIFHPAKRSASTAKAMIQAQAELESLERRWRWRLEMERREREEKAAASAALSRGANRRSGFPVSILGGFSTNSIDSHLQLSAVTQAATWLDRATLFLMGDIHKTINNGVDVDDSLWSSRNRSNEPFRDEDEATNITRSSSSSSSEDDDSLHDQLKEVQRLLYEGSIIQQTTAEFPNLVQLRTSSSASNRSTNIRTKRTTVDSNSTTMEAISGIVSTPSLSPTIVEPASSKRRKIS